MNILFISSGNSKNGISPIILNQGQSLIDLGHKVSYFTIKGKGFSGYAKNVFTLRRYIKKTKFDIIHAHYSLSAFVATLGKAKPLVVSLMGSDVKAKGYYKKIIYFLSKYFWKTVIVKSEDMKNSLSLEKLNVIPNGVNCQKFHPISKQESLRKTGWNASKKHILFAANPSRKVKNFALAKKAFELLNDENLELHYLSDVENEDVPMNFSAADVILLTSLWEGSPNVIKEAMACSRPIVSTEVGDVRWLFGDEDGHFLTSLDVEDVKLNIEKALDFSVLNNATLGRKRIIYLGLDSVSIANQLLARYHKESKKID